MATSQTTHSPQWQLVLLGTALLLISCSDRQGGRSGATKEDLILANRAHLEFIAAYQEEIFRDYLQRTKETPNDAGWKLPEGYYLSKDCSAKLEALTRVFPPQRPSSLSEEEWKCYQESYLAQVEYIRLTRQLFDPDHAVMGDERETLLALLSQARMRAYRF